MRFRWMAVAGVAAAALAGCGGNDAGDVRDAAETDPPTQAETAPGPAASAESLWIATSDSGSVYRVDPATGDVAATIQVGDFPTDLAVGHDSVWVANAESGDVSRIDPQTNQVTATLDTEDARGIAVGDEEVWVSRVTTDPPSVIPIDADDEELGEPIETGEERQPEALIYDDGVLFADEGYSGGVLRIDTEGGDVEALDLDQVVTDIVLHDGSVFAAGLGSVVQVDPESMEIAEEYEEENRPWALAPDEAANSLLVAFQAPELKRLDLADGRFSAAKGSLETTSQPYDVAVAGGYAWVVDEGGTLHQVDLENLTVENTITLPGASGSATMEVG